MKPIRLLFRLIYIYAVMVRYGLDDIVLSMPVFAPVRFLAYLNPFNWGGRKRSQGVRLRKLCEALGPSFVKFGQALSTRRDMLPTDIADELAGLQDRVPPFKQAEKYLQRYYQKSISELFKQFDPEPLASASIAQVHAATLLTGEAVVVKLLRPGVRRKMRRDIELLYAIARMVDRLIPSLRRFKPVEIIEEFERFTTDELDLMYEAGNASQLRRNFEGSAIMHVPKIYWAYARSEVLVQERIYGIPISDIQTLRAHKVNMKKLAERGVEIFFTQVFRDCFFHADMHPGNIFVDITDPENPTYCGVDFGIMGTLGPVDQRYLAENLLAFFNRDYRRVAQLHVDSGWVPADTRIDNFESMIRTVCEPIFERPLSEISAGHMLLRLFQTARRFHMVVQPQLVLLQKTLLSVEGLGRQLYPDLDLWHTAKPFLENWLRQKMGPKAFLKQVRERAPYWLERMPELPDLIHQQLQSASNRYSAAHGAVATRTLSTDAEHRRLRPWRFVLIGAGVALCAVAGLQAYQLAGGQWFVTVRQGIYLGGALVLIGLLARPRVNVR